MANLPVQMDHPILKLPEVQALRHEKWKFFVVLLLRDFNATRAAVDAGYSPGKDKGRSRNSGNSRAWELMRRPEVQKAIQAAYQVVLDEATKEAKKGVLSRQEILERDSELADSNVLDVLQFDERGRISLRNLSELPETVQRAVRKVKVSESGAVDLEMHDKQGPLTRLGKHYGLHGGLAITPGDDDDDQTVEDIEADQSVADRAADWLEGISGRLGTTDTREIVAILRRRKLATNGRVGPE